MVKASKRPRDSDGPFPSKKAKFDAYPPAFPDIPQTAMTRANEPAKDDEERRLESLLFGVPYIPQGKGEVTGRAGREVVDLTVSGMEHLQDEDLFFFDDDTGSVGGLPDVDAEAVLEDAEVELEPDVPGVTAEEEFIGFGSDVDEVQGDEDEDEEASIPTPRSREAGDLEDAPLSSGFPFQTSTRKRAAWVDEDDARLRVSLAGQNRLRKLRESAAEDEVSGKVYETRLRRQFEKVNPVPEWAKKRKPVPTEEERDEEEEDVDVLLNSTDGIVRPAAKGGRLPSGQIALERLRDANQAGKCDGEVKAVGFHPSLPVLLTGGADRRLRLFNIDGHSNPLLQTFHLPALPLTHAIFHPSGTSVFLSGPRPFYYTYDLQSGTISQSPRGLWGSSGPHNPGAEDRSFEHSEFSPDGQVLAVGGRRGNINFVDWRTGGAGGQVVGGVKMNAGVRALQWSGGTGEGRELVSVGEDAEVYVWDVRARRCVRRWRDESGFGPTEMRVSKEFKYMALGSSTGIVNVYDRTATMHGPSVSGNPQALKTVMNLTTRISTLRFNHDSQILCLASRERKDQLKLMHLPSNTVFANWPTSGTPLGHVTSVDFSPNSEYVAIGNNRGRVLLYQLRHYIQ